MKEMLRYLKPYRKGLAAATAGICLSTLCDLLLPTLMSDILNNGVYQADLHYILLCCGVMLLVALVGLVSFIIGSKYSCRVVESYSADLRHLVFRKVNQMSFEEFGQLGTAALVTRCSQDVESVSWLAAEFSGTLFSIPVLFFGGVLLALRKDVLLALTMLTALPLIVAVVFGTARKIVPLWEKCDDLIDQENALIRERLRGIRVIRAFNAEHREHGRIKTAIGTMTECMVRGNVAMDAISPMSMFLLNVTAVVIVYLGGWRMETVTGLSGADIFAIVQYVSLVTSGIIMAAYAIVQFPAAKVAADRIGQVLNAEGMADPLERQELGFSGDIVFEKASFRYPGASECAVEEISLHIRPGQKAAIIGGTGAGKSTLVSMLLGFRMPTSGCVRLDGRPTEQLSRRTIRENISAVLQNATIYSGTIRENVRMGNLNAGEAEIRSALETAQAMEFVSGFPEGLDHEIRQSGKNLSGGQKQRLSIARALVKNAPIAIFDDSFSALDFLTEARLRSALNRYLQGKTQLIVTQRISTAMHCDVIYVLDKGKLVDSGTHEQLLQRCRVYQEIYASQTGGDWNETK